MSAPTTTDPVYKLGDGFEDIGFCNVYTYYPNGELFAVALPFDSICKQETSNAAKEATFMLEGTMYFGLVFLLIIMVRSTNRHKLDWYRLIAFYLVGTLGVPISNEFGTDAAGFNRFIGFGVLVHNMAEAAIIAVIWRGTENQSSTGVRMMILYFWFMIVFITYLPLHPLLIISSLQGATLDFFLVTSFCTIAVVFGKKGGRYFWLAFAASLMHILSIQPLFLGMMLGWTGLGAPTVIFLVPTFMIYIWFASSDPRAALKLGSQHVEPEADLEESIHDVVRQIEPLLANAANSSANASAGLALGLPQDAPDLTNFSTGRSKSAHSAATSTPLAPDAQAALDSKGDEVFKIADGAENDQNDENAKQSNENDQNNGKFELPKVQIPPASMVKQLSQSKSRGMRPETPNNDLESGGMRHRPHSASVSAAARIAATAVLAAGHGAGGGYGSYGGRKDKDLEALKDEADAIALIVKIGLFNTKHFPNAQSAFKRAFLFAFMGAALLEVFLILAPCLLDTKFLCN